MSNQSSTTGRMTSDRVLAGIEFGYWILAVSGAIFVGSILVGLTLGGDLVAVKITAFVLGAVAFGIGSIGLQPTSPDDLLDTSVRSTDDGHRRSITDAIPGIDGEDGGGEHRWEAWLQELPPLRQAPLRFDHRVDRSVKILVTGLVVLAASASLEFVFGIGVS